MKETEEAAQFFVDKVKKCYDNKINPRSEKIAKTVVQFGKKHIIHYDTYNVNYNILKSLRSTYTRQIVSYTFNYGYTCGSKENEIEILHIWVYDKASSEAVKHIAELIELPIVSIDKGAIVHIPRLGKRVQQYVFVLADGTRFYDCGTLYRGIGKHDWHRYIRKQ